MAKIIEMYESHPVRGAIMFSFGLLGATLLLKELGLSGSDNGSQLIILVSSAFTSGLIWYLLIKRSIRKKSKAKLPSGE